MNQWELKASTRNRRQARENARDKSWLVLVLHLNGWVADASFLNQSQSVVKQNQSNSAITFDTQLKTALYSSLVILMTEKGLTLEASAF